MKMTLSIGSSVGLVDGERMPELHWDGLGLPTVIALWERRDGARIPVWTGSSGA